MIKFIKWAFKGKVVKAKRAKWLIIFFVILIIGIFFFGADDQKNYRLKHFQEEFAKKEEKLNSASKAVDKKIGAFNEKWSKENKKMDESFDKSNAAFEEMALGKQWQKVREEIEQEEREKKASEQRAQYLSSLEKSLSIEFKDLEALIQKTTHMKYWRGISSQPYMRWLDNYDDAFYGIILNCAFKVEDWLDGLRKNALATRRFKNQVEEEIEELKQRDSSFFRSDIKVKSDYLKRLTEEDMSIDPEILKKKALKKEVKCIDEAKRLIPIIEKYSPFLKYEGYIDDVTLRWGPRVGKSGYSALGKTQKEMLERAKEVMEIKTPEVENINSDAFNTELSKGERGKFKVLVEDINYRKQGDYGRK